MPIKRDANGRFASGGGPIRSAKLAKVRGHKKAVQDNKRAQA